MTSYYLRLQHLLEQIPSSHQEVELGKLELVVTEFEQILKMVHHHSSELKTKTQYCYEWITTIESGLQKARYGNDQKQRDSSFKKVKEDLRNYITDLAKLISDTKGPKESIY